MDPDELRLWLEWAGAKLLSLPGGRIGPGAIRAIWPQEMIQEVVEGAKAPDGAIRPAPPAAHEMGPMEEVLSWPNLAPSVVIRRVLHARLLVSPTTGKYLYSWARLSRAVNSDPRTVKGWHANGLRQVAGQITSDRIMKLRGISR